MVRGNVLGLGVSVSRVGGWMYLMVESSRAYQARTLMCIPNGRRVNRLAQVLEWIEIRDCDSSGIFHTYSVQGFLIGVRWEVSDLNIQACHWRAMVSTWPTNHDTNKFWRRNINFKEWFGKDNFLWKLQWMFVSWGCITQLRHLEQMMSGRQHVSYFSTHTRRDYPKDLLMMLHGRRSKPGIKSHSSSVSLTVRQHSYVRSPNPSSPTHIT